MDDSGQRDADRVAAVVYNPTKVPVEALRAAVAAQEEEHGWASSLWFETGKEDAGLAAARDAVAAGPEVVLVAGGDGTVRAAAEAIHSTGVPLALLPAGTGNLLARNLHLTLGDLPHAVRVAFTGSRREIDIAFATYRAPDGDQRQQAFVVMAGIGLDAHMAANTNNALKERIGWLAYADPIARSVVGNRRIRFHYRIDGSRPHPLSAHTVIVGNCGTLTANILLLPDAIVDDGLLDVVVFRPRGPLGWAGIGSRLATNGLFARTRSGRWLMRRAPALKGLDYVQARTFDVRFDEPQELELDGDAVGPATAVRLTVRHRALTLLVPETRLTPFRSPTRRVP